MKKAYVLLSGCGSQDGSEIHESVMCLLALDFHGFSAQCIAPSGLQATVVNHLTSSAESQPRQAIVEAARIARGKILPLEQIQDTADILVIPGGLGAATTLCSYAKDSTNATVLPEVRKVVLDHIKNKKPIVATCIAPTILAICLKNLGEVTLTLGTDPEDISWLRHMGMNPVACNSDQYALDTLYRIVTTPAYMEQTTLAMMWKGIEGAIRSAATFT
jgi:enhancing lycopene biosynthesis protein 2